MTESQQLAWVVVAFWSVGFGLLVLGLVAAFSFGVGFALVPLVAGACAVLTAWLGPSRVRDRILAFLAAVGP